MLHYRQKFHALNALTILFLIICTQVAQGGTIPPALLSLSPADDATNVSTRPNMTIVLNESIMFGTGLIQIRRNSDDQVAGSFNISGTNRVEITSTNVADDTLIVNWVDELEEDTDYYISLPAGAITDLAGNDFAGFVTATDWNFMTGDYLEPQVISLTPSDDSINIDPSTNLIIEFDEDIQAGAGNIRIYGGTQVRALEETFDDTSQLTPASVNEFSSNGVSSFFGINFGQGDGSGNWGANPDPTNTTAYSGFDGNYFDASQLVSTGATPRNLDWDNIDITSLTNLSLSLDLAAPTGWGEDDYVQVLVDIDNSGSFTEALEFRGDGDDIAREELTGDNVGDGIPLSTQAKRIHVPISGTGTTIDVRIVVRVRSGGERVGIDNLVVSGISLAPTFVEQVSVVDPAVTITGSTLTYARTATLSMPSEYFIIIDDGAVTDTSLNTNSLTKFTASSAWNFATGDLATIIVQNETTPNGFPQSFTFTGDATGSIQDGEQIVVQNLPTGTYSSSELLPAGWELTSISCDDSDSSGNLGTATATFQLAVREVVTCTFSNTQLSTIIIQNETVPDGSLQSFTFTGDAAGSIQDGEQIVVQNVSPGTYLSSATLPVGWELTSISCNDTDSSGNLSTATTTFEVEAGEIVTCTVTNTQLGTIIIQQETVPDGSPQSFTFTGDAAGSIQDGGQIIQSLPPGTYAASVALLNDWELTSISCDDSDSSGDLSTATVTFEVEAGEVVTCTLTNTQLSIAGGGGAAHLPTLGTFALFTLYLLLAGTGILAVRSRVH